MIMLLHFSIILSLTLIGVPCAKAADDNRTEVPLRYAVGLKADASTGGLQEGVNLRPSVGLAYGRWKLGSVPDDRWLQYGAIFKEPTISFDALQRDKYQLGVSLRVHNIDKQQSWDGFAGGRHTVRGRIFGSRTLSPNLSIGGELTQDLQGRGDGTTLSAGLVRAISLGEQEKVFISIGSTWASASHWESLYANRSSMGEANWTSGVGHIVVAATFRQWIGSHWMWYVMPQISQPMGQIQRQASHATELSLHASLKWVGQLTR